MDEPEPDEAGRLLRRQTGKGRGWRHRHRTEPNTCSSHMPTIHPQFLMLAGAGALHALLLLFYGQEEL
jgi:hypothetical protein